MSKICPQSFIQQRATRRTHHSGTFTGILVNLFDAFGHRSPFAACFLRKQHGCNPLIKPRAGPCAASLSQYFYSTLPRRHHDHQAIHTTLWRPIRTMNPPMGADRDVSHGLALDRSTDSDVGTGTCAQTRQ